MFGSHLFCQMGNFSARTSWDNGNLLMFDVLFLAVTIVIASAAFSPLCARWLPVCVQKIPDAKSARKRKTSGEQVKLQQQMRKSKNKGTNKFCYGTKAMLIINKHDWNAVWVPPIARLQSQRFLLLVDCQKNNMQRNSLQTFCSAQAAKCTQHTIHWFIWKFNYILMDWNWFACFSSVDVKPPASRAEWHLYLVH